MANSDLQSTQAIEVGNQLKLALKLSDPDVIAALEQYPAGGERERFAEAALRIGVLALKHVSGSIDGETVARAGEKLIGDVEQRLGAHAKDIETNLAHSLERYFDPKSGQLSQRLRRLVEDGGELEQILEAHLHGDDSKLARRLAKELGEESPLLARLNPKHKDSVISDIEATVAKLLDEQRQTVLAEFDLNNEDSAIKRMIGQVTQMNDSLSKEFDLKDEASALSALKRMLDETKQRIHQDLTLDNEESSLSRIKREMTQQLTAIIEGQTKFQGEVEKALERLTTAKRERAKSTSHGGDFEHEVLETLIALCSDDVVEHIGEKTGLVKNSKKGDILLTMSEQSAFPGVRIVIEAKQDQSYDLRAALEETEQARKNRGAEVGLFVMSGRTAEGGRNAAHWTRLIQRHGKDVLVVWHPESPESEAVLEAAVSLCKALVLRSEGEDSAEIDFDQLDRALLDIEKQVERFGGLEKQCATIDNAVAKLRDELRIIADKLHRNAGMLVDQVAAIRKT